MIFGKRLPQRSVLKLTFRSERKIARNACAIGIGRWGMLCCRFWSGLLGFGESLS